jgi:hypothetical protein
LTNYQIKITISQDQKKIAEENMKKLEENMKKLVEATLRNEDRFAAYGLRAQTPSPNGTDVTVRVGDTLPNSYDWDLRDGYSAGTEIDGVCAVRVFANFWFAEICENNIDQAVNNVLWYVDNIAVRDGQRASQIILIGGDNSYDGEDSYRHEVVITGRREVLAVWDC